MKIEILEQSGILHERDRYEFGEIRNVDDALGGYFCRMGWAKDVDGNIETGARKVKQSATLEVPPNVHQNTGEVR